MSKPKIKWLKRGERRYFVHTKKAINSKNPLNFGHGDRLYIVVASEGNSLLAWKVDIYEDGFWHPARPDRRVTASWVVTESPQRSAQNGAEPTAFFEVDSFYRELKPEEIFSITASRKAAKPKVVEPTVTFTVPLSLRARAERAMRSHDVKYSVSKE